MRGRWSRAAAAIALFALVAVAVGCAGVSGGVSGASYTRGELRAVVGATPSKIVAATEKAVIGLGWTVKAAKAAEGDGLVSAVTAAGAAVQVKVFSRGRESNASDVAISVGSGDEETSRRLLDKISAGL